MLTHRVTWISIEIQSDQSLEKNFERKKMRGGKIFVDYKLFIRERKYIVSIAT